MKSCKVVSQAMIVLFLSIASYSVNAAATDYPQPYVSSALSPDSGPVGTVVTVRGSGFTGLSGAWIGNGHDAKVSVLSDTKVQVTVPQDATTGQVVLFNAKNYAFIPSSFTVTSAAANKPTVEFSVSPNTINLGQSATLAWSSNGATSCTAGNSWMGAQPISGNQNIKPAAVGTHTYVLTCTGAKGTTKASTQLTVTYPQPYLTSGISPISGSVGTEITLIGSGFIGANKAWVGSAHDAALTVISDNKAIVKVPADGKTGQVAILNPVHSAFSPQSFTVTNGVAAPTVTLTASPTTITSGASSTLAWSSTNATSCTASNGWTGASATSGSLSVKPTSTTSYTLTCSGAGGSANATTTVTVNTVAAPTVTLTASPTTIASGASSTLAWSSTNATSCTASNGWTGASATSGSLSVKPTSTTSYTLTCSGAGGSANATTTVTVGTASTLAIHIKGNQFVNALGTPIQLRGVNLSGMEFVAIGGWDPQDPTGSQFGQPNAPKWSAIQAWKANVVRIPLNETSWLGLTCTDINGNVHNADPGANYKSTLANLVQQANASGLYVILDLHWAAPGSVCPMGQGQMADADHSLAFWTSIANTYQNNPSVIFELFNEPYLNDDFSGNAWSYMMKGTGGGPFTGIPEQGVGSGPLNSLWWEDIPLSWNIASYQAMINAIRATGATNPVLVGGVNYTSDLSGWLANVPTDPAGQMAAAWHAYPTFQQPWANPCVGTNTYCTPNYSPEIYMEVQGILAAGYPVLITETGDHNSTGTVGSPLVSTVTTFADAPSIASSLTAPGATWPAVAGLPAIGVIAWTWDVWGNEDNVLITDVNGTPTSGFGEYFKSWMVNHR